MELIADLHTHTVASGHAYCTIQELATVAAEKEIEIIAMTDHGPNMPGGAHPYHFGNLKVLPREICGVRVLKGVEANVTDRHGTLDLGTEYLAKLDLVLVGFHEDAGYNPGTREENTTAMVNAIVNPLVDIVVHPGNPAYEVDISRVIKAAKENNTLLEINNSSYRSRPGSREYCIEIAQRAQEAGLELILGTDTHYSDQLGEFPQALEIVDQAGLEASNIVNTSLERVEKFIAQKREVKEQVLEEIN
ncbi:phosphatase [Halanaerobaculum tunisiense]